LTATYGLRQLLPLVPSDKIPLCLRVDLAVSLTYYVSRGRPLVQPEKLPQTPYSWDDIIKKTWTNEDLHVPKVIRALKTISEAGEMDATLARNAAGIVVQEKIDGGRRWSFLGHGFDEAWEQKEAGDENERD
jgi:Questin oxidase-like